MYTFVVAYFIIQTLSAYFATRKIKSGPLNVGAVEKK